MNPGTDTRFVIPDPETRSRIERHHNNREHIYRGRHSTDTCAAPSPRVGRHHVDDSITRLIEPVPSVVAKVAVPLSPRPTVPAEVSAAAVPTPPIEPPAPITDGLLERVLRGLRALRVMR